MSNTQIVKIKIPDIESFKIVVGSDASDPITQSIKGGNYTLPTQVEIMLAAIEPKVTVIDIGAHIGTFSLPAAALGYNVLAIEASISNVQLLQASARLNGFANLHIIHAAITNHVGTVMFFENGPYGLINTPVFAPTASSEVPATTLDALLEQLGMSRIGFIKMDIEGSEFDALRGMPHLLSMADAPPLLYESNGHTLALFGQEPESLVAELGRFGYTCYLAEPGRLRPLDPTAPQYSCVVDNLACKQLTGQWRNWVTGAMSNREQIERALVECNASWATQRKYIARALKKASPTIRGDLSIRQALRKLRTDSDNEVAEEAKWSMPLA